MSIVGSCRHQHFETKLRPRTLRKGRTVLWGLTVDDDRQGCPQKWVVTGSIEAAGFLVETNQIA